MSLTDSYFLFLVVAWGLILAVLTGLELIDTEAALESAVFVFLLVFVALVML